MTFTVTSKSFKDGDYLGADHILSADFGFGCAGGNKSPHLAWSGAPAGTKSFAVTCFDPDPVTTQGEAEFAGRMAATHHWASVVLVTSRPQDTRARLRMAQCFGGRISVATAPLPRREWPKAVAYEWGALAKALKLAVIRLAAIDRQRMQAALEKRQLVNLLRNLNGQFARGAENENLR